MGDRQYGNYPETAFEEVCEQTVKAPGQLTRFGQVELSAGELGYLSGNATYQEVDRRSSIRG
jgi:hypothetical protein